MKRKILLLSVLLLLGIPTVRAETVISQAVSDLDDYVVEVTLSPALAGQRFAVGWVDHNLQQWQKVLVAKAGKNVYEMRDHPAWRGEANVVAVSLDAVTGELKKPSLGEEVNLFMNPEQWQPSTVNLIYGHTFWGYSENAAFYLLFLLLTAVVIAIFYDKKIRMIQGLLLVFVLLWAAGDARNMYDHWSINREVENMLPAMPGMGQVAVINADLAKLVEGSTWQKNKIKWPYNTNINYALAEEKRLTSGADFLITNQAGTGIILVEDYGVFKLIRQK